MVNGATKPVDQRLLELYQSEYYERTDVVYRFGLILTGSRDGAERVAEETYRVLLEEFDSIKPSTDATCLLMALAWKSWQKLKGERFHEWSQPTLNAVRKLNPDERAVLYVVDMAGVEPRDAAKLMGASEREIRMALSSARRRIATGEIKL